MAAARFCSLVFLAAACALQADQVVLKNGDRVTGMIVKKDGKTLTMKSDHFGIITMPWDEVESIKSDTPLNVVLSEGATVEGPVATAGGNVEVRQDGNTRAAPLSGVVAIRNAAEQAAYNRMLNPGWTSLWAGSATLGLAGTTGNAQTATFTTGVNAARVTRTDKTSIHFEAIKASAEIAGLSATTAQAVRGGIGYDHNLSPRLFVSGFNDYEYDRFQDLDLRFVLGGGVGFHAFKRERTNLDLSAGIDYNHSTFGTPLTRSSAEFYWGDDFNYKLSGATSLVQGFRMFNNLSDAGEYRMNFDFGITTRLLKWLNWNANLSDRYLSNPVPGRKANDLLYSTGVGVAFAR
jgi:putative salt-induced outer membrane protein YdiY